jgi:sodium transport system permease protein
VPPSRAPARGSQVLVLYRKELRSALRERSIVLNSVLIPIFLYPVMLWLMFTGLTFAEGLAEGTSSRVSVHGLTPEHMEVLDTLRVAEMMLVADTPATVAESEARLARGELDAVVVFEPLPDTTGMLAGNFSVRIAYDRSLERSRRARERAEQVVERHRERWLTQRAQGMAIPREEVEGFRVAPRNVATGEQLGTSLLSEMLPLFLVVMVALGCFIPAIDTTAGERERSTWETTLTVAAPRFSIVAAKYLYVATLGVSAGVLNVLAMFLSMGAVMAPLLSRSGEDFRFSLPGLALPVMVLGAIALALFFAAAMMILAAFARSFKEGQGMVTPVYWLALVPLMLSQGSDATLTPATAAIPVANVAMMIRDAVRGVFLWPLIAETVLVELGTVVLCLFLARAILGFEDFLIGSYDGSFWRFLKERMLGRPKAARS